MVPLHSPDFQNIAKFLQKYDLKTTTTQLAALLTIPEFHANTLRIEVLVHLAIANCSGKRKPTWREIGNWLNRQLIKTRLVSLEDPVEDVFVTNIETAGGNRLVLEGHWEACDYYTQITLNVLDAPSAPPICGEISRQANALLTLMDAVAVRLDLRRWETKKSTPGVTIPLAPKHQIELRSKALCFSDTDLASLGVSRKMLDPFVLGQDDFKSLSLQEIGFTSAERRPILDFGDCLVLALPSAVSLAVRRYTLDCLSEHGLLNAFSHMLHNFQATQIDSEGLSELKPVASSVDAPQPVDELPPLHAWLLNFDSDKYLQILLIHDDLDSTRIQGFSSFNQTVEKKQSELEKYVAQVAKHCQSKPGFSEGMTLFIMGGIGGGFSLGIKKWPDNWLFSALGISDLLMLAEDKDDPIKHFLKCIKQKDWLEKEGVKFININGFFNYYCSWQQQNYQVIRREFSVSNRSIIHLPNDMVFPVRKEIRELTDRHMALDMSRNYISVVRFGKSAFFESMKWLPIYACAAKLSDGKLSGLVESSRGPCWLNIDITKNRAVDKSLLADLWSGLLGLLPKLVEKVEALCQPDFNDPIEIELNFEHANSDFDNISETDPSSVPSSELMINLETKCAEIKLAEGLFSLFRHPENHGERFIVDDIARCMVMQFRNVDEIESESEIQELVDSVLSDSRMRLLHLFEASNPIDLLQSVNEQPAEFVSQEDLVFAKLKLSEGCTNLAPGKQINSKSECIKFLNDVVDKLWTRIRDKLNSFDRLAVIRMAIGIHEADINDRQQWQRTSAAMLSLYGSNDDVVSIAQEREGKRTAASLSARTIIEMAICECPMSGGKIPSKWELDEIVANVVLLIEVAMDSDAIHSDFVQPRVELYENGEYSIDDNSRDIVLASFQKAYHEFDFQEKVNQYSSLYSKNLNDRGGDETEMFPQDFITAFEKEFGLTPDDSITGFAALVDLAILHNSVAVETTMDELMNALVGSQGLSEDSANAFIKTFSLSHRPSWSTPPDGFKMNDLYPWRFRRRLSATARPVVLLENEDPESVLFGIGSLKLGFEYLIFRSAQGQLPQNFFVSLEMQSYIGQKNNEAGSEFTKWVSDELRKAGWNTRTEVNMTELGGKAEQGDVDVLAWTDDGQVQLIECKNLQLARTVAEIGEICRRFRGEAKDELGKHLARVSWLEDNPSNISKIVKFEVEKQNIDNRLITNAHVPISYLTKLPLSQDKIGRLSESGLINA